jgi:hypothetical protein
MLTNRGTTLAGSSLWRLNRLQVSIASLLELDGRALLFEFLLELLGVFLRERLLDGLRSGLDEVLGFLQTQARGRANDLDDLDLLVAAGLEDDVEGALGLFGRGSRATTRGRARPS